MKTVTRMKLQVVRHLFSFGGSLELWVYFFLSLFAFYQGIDEGKMSYVILLLPVSIFGLYLEIKKAIQDFRMLHKTNFALFRGYHE